MTTTREQYQVVDKWLNKLSDEEIASIEAERTRNNPIDRGFVIETILEHCNYEDDLLLKLYNKSKGKLND